ncbi:hypothetical protein C1701_08995 [Actinoalloteichus sp. AHMU CJ021]|nr:hypothetical protein C1701_08995 [Actinoalloteichus sp. AHMU CJ021]
MEHGGRTGIPRPGPTTRSRSAHDHAEHPPATAPHADNPRDNHNPSGALGGASISGHGFSAQFAELLANAHLSAGAGRCWASNPDPGAPRRLRGSSEQTARSRRLDVPKARSQVTDQLGGLAGGEGDGDGAALDAQRQRHVVPVGFDDEGDRPLGLVPARHSEAHLRAERLDQVEEAAPLQGDRELRRGGEPEMQAVPVLAQLDLVRARPVDSVGAGHPSVEVEAARRRHRVHLAGHPRLRATGWRQSVRPYGWFQRTKKSITGR